MKNEDTSWENMTAAQIAAEYNLTPRDVSTLSGIAKCPDWNENIKLLLVLSARAKEVGRSILGIKPYPKKAEKLGDYFLKAYGKTRVER